jgi:hypothetical protein
MSLAPVFSVVFGTDSNSIVPFFVVNTTNTDLEKVFQKLSTTGEAEQSVEPEPRTTRFQNRRQPLAVRLTPSLCGLIDPPSIGKHFVR